MLQLVNEHEKRKKIYSISKESNKLSKSWPQTEKNDIKYETKESIKNRKKEAKTRELNQLKTSGNTNPDMDDTHKEVEILI